MRRGLGDGVTSCDSIVAEGVNTRLSRRQLDCTQVPPSRHKGIESSTGPDFSSYIPAKPCKQCWLGMPM